MKKILIAATFITLAGCASKSSPERHALYYARHDPTMSGGNYVKNPTETARSNLPTYQKIYKQGQEAKIKGFTLEQAQSVAEEINQASAHATSGTETYMNMKEHKTQITPDARASQLWGQTLKDTFMDGYNGVK
ncbi:Exc2 family lipoprotein [Citrobacter sp. Cpo030]|uniref:Exc2 family lipoprotein n=1 Tax=Citrobacter TaxID=544 RepID=UPI0025764F4C|nr:MULTISPECIES: Exc2 family lipoprotein [Citrobacter]MDM2896783.1 Exc2 family lipoprotein [Citrobacter sp. Cpo030]MDN4386609.1 Exc2 family lipoprotein [Citrobacter portucalensis]MDN4405001.1 Exc2 family lipoprotein [Citrobacter portucalensis]